MLAGLIFGFCLIASAGAETAIKPLSEVEWEALNPARGDQSPRAATLWGDRAGTEATGFLVRFADGFSSPPHIHNVSYRGVVISGLIHNDDPAAEKLWMPTGSYWTQPAGDVHITAARGTDNLAYIEIESAPYLVRPPSSAFDNGERPVNDLASEIVWAGKPEFGSPSTASAEPDLAALWGEGGGEALNGSLLRLPAGSGVRIDVAGPELRAVVIEGRVYVGAAKTALGPGGSIGTTDGDAVPELSCHDEDACLLYVRASGGLKLTTR
ncbi:MAG: DUF4437 domain-containing protein [Pseudomonadota bacterium]